jgi:hypothetical protein
VLSAVDDGPLAPALPNNAGVRTLNYDPLNRLDLYNPGTAKRFIYDGPEVVAELDASGNIIARYVRGDAPQFWGHRNFGDIAILGT